MRTILLKKFALARYDDASPFPLGDLKIKVEGLPKYEGVEIRFVAKMNGAEVAKVALTEKSNTITINQDLLDCGEFKAAVIVYNKGVKIEEYEIEPLLIKEVNGEFFADPVIAALDREVQKLGKCVEALKEENSQLKKQLTELTERAAELSERVNILMDFANNCITQIPYINDLQLKEEK